MKYDAIIVGGGHNGLVTAAYLGRAGQRVLVLERRPVLGGAAVTEELFPGFKTDSCAQGVGWLHPHIVRELELARHGLEFVPRAPTLFAPLPDGDHLLLGEDRRNTVEAIRRFSQQDAGRWEAFNAQKARLLKLLEALYAITPPHAPAPTSGDVLSLLGVGRRLGRFRREDLVEALQVLPMSVADWLDDWFETDVLKGALGADGVTGIFQGPRAAGTAFVLLHHHMGSREAGLRPMNLVRGGIGNLVHALAQAARRHGVEIRTGVEVAQVLVREGEANGVVLQDGAQIAARRVVSNADPRRTFVGLVDPLHLDPQFLWRVRNIKLRGVCARVSLALDRLPDFTALPGPGPHLHGAILISPALDYLERAYDDAKYGRVSRRPYLAVTLPTASDPALAPPGKHVLSALVQYAPYHLRDGTWDDARREALGDAVVEALSAYAPNLAGTILHRQVLTPLDLEQTYGLSEGHIYHGELTLDQILFMRPAPGWAHYRTPIQNLYLCGAGTHPGGGVNGAPGYHAAREILKNVKCEA